MAPDDPADVNRPSLERVSNESERDRVQRATVSGLAGMSGINSQQDPSVSKSDPEHFNENVVGGIKTNARIGIQNLSAGSAEFSENVSTSSKILAAGSLAFAPEVAGGALVAGSIAEGVHSLSILVHIAAGGEKYNSTDLALGVADMALGRVFRLSGISREVGEQLEVAKYVVGASWRAGYPAEGNHTSQNERRTK